MSMRSAASCCQPLQLSVDPRGARTVRGPWAACVEGMVTTDMILLRGDRSRERREELVALNQLGETFDVGRQNTIALERRHDGAHRRVRARHAAAGLERRA